MTEASARPLTSQPESSARGRAFSIIALIIVVGAVAWGVYWFMFLRNTESTDDAYVGGHLVAVTAQVAGTVIAVGADDTNTVTAGQVLVRLDPADAQVGLEQAESALARTVRQVRTQLATVSQYKASEASRRADVAKARDDLARRRRLAQSGAISEEELRHATESLRSAEAASTAAEQQTAAAAAMVEGIDIAHHPDVENAAAKVRDAYLALARTTIPAPVAGTVARRSVQVGSRVNPGAPMMSIVTLDQVWVDANFKESQLADMRIGQPAEVEADLYGDKVAFRGTVIGVGAGTGSAFALLPAQNATGNWVKVVQRVPVRIALDAKELTDHPLAVGLSMHVKVDTKEQGGNRIAPTPGTVTETKVFEEFGDKANARIAAIIAAHTGAPAH